MMATAFKRRLIPAERLAEVEAATADIPLSGAVASRSDWAGASTGAKSPIAGPKPKEVVPGQPPVDLTATEVVAYEVGRIYDIAVNALSSNPANPRVIYPVSAVKALADSLVKNGQRVAVTAYVGDHGSVFLIEGETRLRGARLAGIHKLRVEMRPRPDSNRKLYEEARAINVERRDQTPLDDAIRWKELIADGTYENQKALAVSLNVSEDLVSRTLSLATLPSRLVDAVAEYPKLMNLKMLNAIREYCGVCGEDEAHALIFEIDRKGLGTREVTARRIAAERGPVKRPRSVHEAIAFRGVKGLLRSFEGTGRLELSLKGLTPDAIEDLTQRLHKVLAE